MRLWMAGAECYVEEIVAEDDAEFLGDDGDVNEHVYINDSEADDSDEHIDDMTANMTMTVTATRPNMNRVTATTSYREPNKTATANPPHHHPPS